MESFFEQLLAQIRFVDLTHPLTASVPTWTGSCGFEHSIKMDYEQGCRVQNIKMHAGVGTHMDAPSHFIPFGASISDISVEHLIVPIYVIDISTKVIINYNPSYELSVQDILDYEAKFGSISNNALVVAYTGWEKYWNEPRRYRNENEDGMMVFPSFSAEAAELLVQKKVVGIGIDTLSPDRPDSSFPVHHIVLGAGKYIIENLANCSLLPPKGACAIVLPLNVVDGTESAIRAIGMVL